MQGLATLAAWVGKTFAVWAIISAALGFAFPDTFAPLTAYIVPILGVIMFGMGLSLQLDDFKAVLKRPKLIAVGVVAQFVLMPLIAFLLTEVFALPPLLALGVILVGCCPGGTSSNVITFLAKGDVALSVSITSVSTLLAPILTPMLLKLYAGQWINIDLLAMMGTISKIVLIPIVLGLLAHRLLGNKTQAAVDVLPLLSVAGIVVIIAAVIAVSHDTIMTSGVLVFAVVMLHNLLGFFLGFVVAKLSGFTVTQRRAIMVEVGMQNSGLGAALAASYFNPVAALPSAIFSVWHNISGALLANSCQRRTHLPSEPPTKPH